jgi:N,N'-diacetyllegionaminate synthase
VLKEFCMSNKVIIIAEAGVNHNGDLSMAKKLIDAAAGAGADYVKFQTFKAESLVSMNAAKAAYQVKNIGEENGSQYSMLKKLEMPDEWHYILEQYAEEKGIQFLSTGFDEKSIDFLDQLGTPFFKIPSGEITNKPYLENIAAKKKPVILSTGMADLSEIEDALDVITACGISKDMISVLHCNTEYPTPMKDVNLRAMRTIRDTFDIPVGYSDHTLGIEVPIAAVALGAVIIEKHFTLDRNLPGPDHKASLEPAELTAMVKAIRNIELCLGDGIKVPSESESKNKVVARKSIHLLADMKKDTVLQKADLIMKRPGNGISPMRIDEVIGKKIKNDLSADTLIRIEDIE